MIGAQLAAIAGVQADEQPVAPSSSSSGYAQWVISARSVRDLSVTGVALVTPQSPHVPPAARKWGKEAGVPVMEVHLQTAKVLVRGSSSSRYSLIGPLSYQPKVYDCDRESLVLDTLPTIYWGAVRLRPGFIRYYGTGIHGYGMYLLIARPFDHAGQPGHRDVKGYDLRSAQPELCVKLVGTTLGGQIWESNVAAVPLELVAAAIATAPR